MPHNWYISKQKPRQQFLWQHISKSWNLDFCKSWIPSQIWYFHQILSIVKYSKAYKQHVGWPFFSKVHTVAMETAKHNKIPQNFQLVTIYLIYIKGNTRKQQMLCTKILPGKLAFYICASQLVLIKTKTKTTVSMTTY